ncbi:MAG: hypothetical protein AB1806_20450 [Acidobacteriota bacterium]
MNTRDTQRGSPAWRRTLTGAWFAWILASGAVLAAPAKPATKLVNVADTRAMDPGLGRWIADVYNTNLWWFGALVVVTMVAMGLILGLVTDRLVGLLGINLGRIAHHE